MATESSFFSAWPQHIYFMRQFVWYRLWFFWEQRSQYFDDQLILPQSLGCTGKHDSDAPKKCIVPFAGVQGADKKKHHTEIIQNRWPWSVKFARAKVADSQVRPHPLLPESRIKREIAFHRRFIHWQREREKREREEAELFTNAV